jgi:hypothetical protein
MRYKSVVKPAAARCWRPGRRLENSLIDIFGRTFPEKTYFSVDRDAVGRCKQRVRRERQGAVRDDPAQCGGGSSDLIVV